MKSRRIFSPNHRSIKRNEVVKGGGDDGGDDDLYNYLVVIMKTNF